MMSNFHQALLVAVNKAYHIRLEFEVFKSCHADYTSNIAFQCATQLLNSPMACANAIVRQLKSFDALQIVACVEPGYINVNYEKTYWTHALKSFLQAPMLKVKTYDYPDTAHDLKQLRQQAQYRFLGRFMSCGEVHVKGDIQVLSDAQKLFHFLQVPARQDIVLDVSAILEPSIDNSWHLVCYAYQRNEQVLSHLSKWIEPKVDLSNMVWSGLSLQLLQLVLDYQYIFQQAIKQKKVYLVLNHLKNLARTIHCYYNEVTLINQCHIQRLANMMLLQASQKVLAHGLILLGVDFL